MKIVVIGTRGIPDISGGVETHCEELYPRIAAMGHNVTVIRRSCYVDEHNHLDEYRGVRLRDVYAPRKKQLEALVHTFLATLSAWRLHPDVLHVHAIGPSLLVPMARLLGMKVVMTNHGPDYNRQKWGRIAKTMLKLGERVGTKWANEIIAISSDIVQSLQSKYDRSNANLIYNGVNKPRKSKSIDYIESLGLSSRKYIVALGRFVKEKGFHDLIEAFEKIDNNDYKLVIAGDSDHEDGYSLTLKNMARDAGVVLTGYIKGERLNQVMSNAALYVMPSYHEGLPISLLEAMSYGLDVVVSDIPANRLSCLSSDDFFKTGNVVSLQQKIEEKLSSAQVGRTYDLSKYDWDKIASQTVDVYRRIVSP